jgi:hypothetical protein
MKKFFKNGLLFLLFFIVTYPIGVCITGEFAPYHFRKSLSYKIGGYGFLHSKIKEIDKYRNADILIIGTSHAYRGFDPRIFKENGITTLNLASSIQTPIQTNLIFKRYLDKINPKLVVYDVNPEVFNNDGIEAGLDLISNDYVSFDSFKMAFKINDIRLYNTLIFALYKQTFNANKNFKEDINKNDDVYISGGYVEKKLKYNKDKKTYKPQSFEFNDFQLDYFKENIDFLNKKNIPFVLIHTPITKKLYASKMNYKKIDSSMNKLSNGNYYDFNKLTQLSDTLDFYDSNHLNTIGVRKFDDFFIQFMRKEKIIKN